MLNKCDAINNVILRSMHISLSHSIVLTLAPHLLMACAWNIFIYPYIIMFVVVCAVHIFAHVSISYWTLTRVLIHAPILSQCHYHILHSLISILHLINIFYALSIHLSFLVCYLLWPIYLRSMCVCLCHQNEKQIIIFIVVVFARSMQRCIIAKISIDLFSVSFFYDCIF